MEHPGIKINDVSMCIQRKKTKFPLGKSEEYLENLGRSERNSRIPSVPRREVKVFEAEKKEHWKSVWR